MLHSLTARIICLVLLAAASGIHLFAPFDRKITKPFLLLLIAAYYITSVETPSALLLAALLTSWLGDVLLMPKGDKWFVAGGISFMLSHFLFIAVYTPRVDFSLVRWYIAVPAAILYLGISAVIIKLVKPTTPKMMVAPMYIYLVANSSMNFFALMQLMSNPGAAGAVAYIGAVLFFASDCTLFMVRYYKNGYFKSHFWVMLTYILGELMITQGVIMFS